MTEPSEEAKALEGIKRRFVLWICDRNVLCTFQATEKKVDEFLQQAFDEHDKRIEIDRKGWIETRDKLDRLLKKEVEKNNRLMELSRKLYRALCLTKGDVEKQGFIYGKQSVCSRAINLFERFNKDDIIC